MRKTMTLAALAKELGLSESAVSKALNDYPDISPATKKLVREQAEALGYSPNLLARNLARKTTNFVGIVIRDVSSIYGEMYKSLTVAARHRGLHPILYDTGNDSGLEQESIRNLLDTKAMGIILVPVAEDPDMIRRKTRNKVPVVFLGSKVRSSEVNYVCTDTAAGTELALRHLTHLGHREIVMLCDSKTSGSRSRRIFVYRQIMQELGQEPRIFPIPPDEQDLSQAGYQLTRKLLSSGIRFTAIYACKDMLAIGAMGALTEAGIRIPEQVSVVGYDGIDAAALPMIRLTTVAQPRTEMAEQVIDMLCRHAEDLSLPPEHCLAAPQLILRSSTGPV